MQDHLALNDHPDRKEHIRMALAYIFDYPNSTHKHYDEFVAKLEELKKLEHGKSYPGQLFHAAGPTENGFRVVDIWESKEACDKFLQEEASPLIQAAGIAPPRIESWPVHNILMP